MLIRTSKAIPDQTLYGTTATYQKIHEGLLPPVIKIGPRASAFILAELDAVKQARIAGATDEEIKQLVAKLVAKRKRVASPAVDRIDKNHQKSAAVAR